MSDIAVRVENLSTRYCIGPREPYKARRDVIPTSSLLFFAVSVKIRHSQSEIARRPVSPVHRFSVSPCPSVTLSLCPSK